MAAGIGVSENEQAGGVLLSERVKEVEAIGFALGIIELRRADFAGGREMEGLAAPGGEFGGQSLAMAGG